MHTSYKIHRSPSTFGWALLLLAVGTAVFLRFYNLANWPPGLYRDEAFNGLDALRVLDGEPAVFFTANNGREPLYIMLTALSVVLFGRTVLAVRLVAAVVGSLTTLLVYKLGQSWFGWRAGLLAAWLWAITLWPLHLSRLGLRTILLPAVLTLAFWLGTEAYRRNSGPGRPRAFGH
jgi:4-amino-4-deoxy-L-arabinose transferase-like glycosyltransferase